MDLPPQQTQRRFQKVFSDLLGVFARAEHPLVLFLDDLQWVDAATLDLIANLMTHIEMRYVLLVGAYRANEVDDSHPLLRRLATLREAGGAVSDIALAPLPVEDIGRLIADALHCPAERAQPLAQLVFEKTGGNPFFANQFLATLADEKLVRFDPDAGWSWDLRRIHTKRYTDNVVELMVGKLSRLPQEAREALEQFACLGNAADVTTLGLVLQQPPQAVLERLWQAERLGLVVRHEGGYTFLHDRVQEAAYSLIPPDAHAATHLRIGRLLASTLAPEAIAERIFDVVNQINRGIDLVESRAERERIAELNLMAGRRAREATAYALALNYLAAGLALLPQDRWDSRYKLSFEIEIRLAECEFLTGALSAADARLTELARRATGLVDLAAVACLQVDLLTTMGRTQGSVDVLLAYMQRIGEVWQAHPTADEVAPEYERMWRQIGDRPIESLLDLPPMTDEIACATMEVLNRASPPALFTDMNLCCLVIGRMANLCLEHGNSDSSCMAYVSLGTLLGPAFGQYVSAFRFGQLGVDMVEKHRLRRFEARVFMLFGSTVNFWMRHVRTSLSPIKRSCEAAQRAGDVTFIGFTRTQLINVRLATSDPLVEVQAEAAASLESARQTHFIHAIDRITTQFRLILMLRGLTTAFGSFNGAGFDEGEFEQHLAANPNLALPSCSYWIRRLQGLYLAGDHPAAACAATKARDLLWTLPYFLEFVEYHYYAALTHAALCGTASASERPLHMQALEDHHRQLRNWAENCPENFESRAALVAAEIARLEGREMDSQRLFEQAIRSARDNGFAHMEAIAYERAGAFYLARGYDKIAVMYLRNARTGYLRWGADAKARQLEALYPQLLAASPQADATVATGAEQLDLLSLAKASQAISSELLLDELAGSLLRSVLENATAQNGWLLLARGNDLTVAAEASGASNAVAVKLRQDQPPADAQLPTTILNFVRRSKEAVLLHDVAQQHPFSGDPYLAAHPPKSLLCLPIVRQSVLIGWLYLENHLVTHAFPPERLAVLEVLASQAARARP